ncbi:protein CADMIUM TOLERANCE 3-like [Lolium rigidum]|nr:protein CADMIUM TOLERANCE 3-like [Lolium rigidum]
MDPPTAQSMSATEDLQDKSLDGCCSCCYDCCSSILDWICCV